MPGQRLLGMGAQFEASHAHLEMSTKRSGVKRRASSSKARSTLSLAERLTLRTGSGGGGLPSESLAEE